MSRRRAEQPGRAQGAGRRQWEAAEGEIKRKGRQKGTNSCFPAMEKGTAPALREETGLSHTHIGV